MLPHEPTIPLLLGCVFQFFRAVAAWEISDVPAPDLFLRRGLANVVVLGDYLYIDGGEVSQLDAEGKPYTFSNGTRGSHRMNSTLSIDLSGSWSPANVSFRTIPKEPWGMDRQALWKREETNSFYVWGGHTSDTERLLDESLATGSWKFQADGAGGGQWSKETPRNPTEFRELERSEDGAFASTLDSGFWFGGLANARTRLNSTNGGINTFAQPIPGMVVYDWKTNQWSNKTEEFKNAFPPFGTVRGARAIFIPKYGENGIVVLMGGFMPTLEPLSSGKRSNHKWMEFSNITFMDPVTRKWHIQKTTGPAPTQRHWFCMVGVEGDDTYEIFVFGGIPGYTERAYDDVFVLSLPGFVWKQVPYEDREPRTDHHCAVIGKRQMVVVGGRNTTKTAPLATSVAGWADPDPWPQGLGLFDMTEWAWKTEYNASADAYHSHEEIQNWYREQGFDSVEWSSDEVKSIFSHKKNGVSAGIIAGAVIGAVAGVGLLVFAGIWFIRRKRSRETSPIIAPPHPEDKDKIHDALHFPLQPSEIDGHGRVELSEDQALKQELPTTMAPVELDARQDLARP